MRQITILLGGAPVLLNLIAEGGFSSEYMARNTNAEIRLKVRHSKEKPSSGSVALDRHNVEITMRTYPSPAFPAGQTFSTYMVIRSDPNSPGDEALDLVTALLNFVGENAGGLVAWGSDFTDSEGGSGGGGGGGGVIG